MNFPFLTIDIVTAYDRIIKKVRNGKVPVAVFIVSGRAREAAIDSDLYREVSTTMPDKLLGIYDKSVLPDWLLNDLKNAESEACHEYRQSIRPRYKKWCADGDPDI